MRTTTSTVTFRSAFCLPGWEAPWPAGTYQVSTDEEPLETSFPAFHRVATRIELRRGSVTLSETIDPNQLAAALAFDRAHR